MPLCHHEFWGRHPTEQPFGPAVHRLFIIPRSLAAAAAPRFTLFINLTLQKQPSLTQTFVHVFHLDIAASLLCCQQSTWFTTLHHPWTIVTLVFLSLCRAVCPHLCFCCQAFSRHYPAVPCNRRIELVLWKGFSSVLYCFYKLHP